MNAANPQTIHRVMHEIKRRKLEVLRLVVLTPRMRRITLGGPELAGFISQGSDDHVKLFFPQTVEEQAALENLLPAELAATTSVVVLDVSNAAQAAKVRKDSELNKAKATKPRAPKKSKAVAELPHGSDGKGT